MNQLLLLLLQALPTRSFKRKTFNFDEFLFVVFDPANSLRSIPLFVLTCQAKIFNELLF
jgi:hypothetical protein